MPIPIATMKSKLARRINRPAEHNPTADRTPRLAPALFTIVAMIALGVILFEVSQYNYIVYHTLVELFTIIIACSIFMLVANSYKFLDSHYFLFLAHTFFYTAIIDFFHLLSYKGVDIFPVSLTRGANLATQLWTADRLVFTAALLISPLFFNRKVKPLNFFVGFLFPVVLIFISTFWWQNYPDAYIDGLTPFKKIVEYIFIAALSVSLIFVLRAKRYFSSRVHRLLIHFFGLTALSEIFFVSYIDVYGINNFLGHYIRLIAYYFAYRALLAESIVNPYDTLFYNLKQSEIELKENKVMLETKAKELRQERDEGEAFLSSLGEGIVAVDQDGKIRYVNKSFERLFSVRSATIIGKTQDKIVPLYDKTGKLLPLAERPISKVLLQKKKGLVKDDTVIAFHPNGSKLLLAVTASPIFYGRKIRGAIAVYHDVTKERELDKIKSEFISIAAHQLRTPLTTIGLTAEVMAKGVVGKVDMETKRYLNDIEAEIKNMSQIIDTFLEISRIEMGLLPIRRVEEDLANLLRDWCQAMHPLIQKRGINFKFIVPESIPVLTDQNFLKTVFDNILSNAIKYTPEKGKVTVRALQRDADVVISVEDSGYGIPKEQRHRVFDKLFRAENVIGTRGTGLGLYVAKRMIEQIGGTIWFEPNKSTGNERGTTFYISLPQMKKERR